MASTKSLGRYEEDIRLELHEMPEAREDSLCCGMGGGGFGRKRKKHERFSNLRVEQAI